MRIRRIVYAGGRDKQSIPLLHNRYGGKQEDPEKLSTVQHILDEVRAHGDQALLKYGRKWDREDLGGLQIEKAELEDLAKVLGVKEKKALDTALDNITLFHRDQRHQPAKTETTPGVVCWKESRPIERVGIYVPGGSAPLISTFLMLAIPARLAEVAHLIVCTPSQRSGPLVHPAIAYLAGRLAIETIHLVGGAQAIAAMAIGTEKIMKVDKIFGPGNSYVTLAKQLVQFQTSTAIDMPAGPSEVLIIADHQCNAAFVASDLLAQAEHGPDSQVVLACPSSDFLDRVEAELALQLDTLPRRDIATCALNNSYFVLTRTVEDAFMFSNEYAPEHLVVSIEDFEPWLNHIRTAGSVFLGPYSPESAGDYASGTNHTLPTAGYARMYSGVSVDSFVKSISFQTLSSSGILHLGETVEILARMEGLEAHARSVSVRLAH